MSLEVPSYISEEPIPHNATARLTDADVSYIDSGDGTPIVFVHGAGTTSYMWRNIIPQLKHCHRCLVPDLVGFGKSSRIASKEPNFETIFDYFSQWMAQLDLTEPAILVGHEYGAAWCAAWAKQHPEKVKGFVHLEGYLRPLVYSDIPPALIEFHELLIKKGHDEIVLDQDPVRNWMMAFLSKRELRPTEREHYYVPKGSDRLPLLTLTKERPVDGKPQHMHEKLESLAAWLQSSVDLPKLFVCGVPGAESKDQLGDFYRSFPNQTEVFVEGVHFLTEDSPREIADSIADFAENI